MIAQFMTVKLFSFPLSISLYLYNFLCSRLKGTLTLLMSKPCICVCVCVVILQTWQWAVRSEVRSVEGEYWSLMATKTYPHKVWRSARSWGRPTPQVTVCLDLDSLWEEAKMWTTISTLVNTQQIGPSLLSSPRYNQDSLSGSHSFASRLSFQLLSLQPSSSSFLTSTFHRSPMHPSTTISMFSPFLLSSFSLVKSSEAGIGICAMNFCRIHSLEIYSTRVGEKTWEWEKKKEAQ